MRARVLLLTTALVGLPPHAMAQVSNTYCAQNPAACQPVVPAYGYGAPGAYGGYPVTAYAGPDAPAYAGAGYGGTYGWGGGYGYPPPGYYAPGGPAQLQAQSLAAITTGPQALPGQFGQPASPFPSNQAPQIPASAPPHPANPDFERYSAGVFGDANRPAKVVQRTARSAGIQAGYAEETRRIADHLATPEITGRLDARYPFAELMVGHEVVPPVVSELRGLRAGAGPRVLITTLGSFEILRPARLAVAVPSWRDYLVVPPPPAEAATWTPPKGSEEQANWDVGYEAGLAVGIAQARAAFDDSLARLERDLTGMRRYHELAAQGAASLPVVRARGSGLRLARNGRTAAVGERVVELVVAPKFRRTAAAAYD